jgi:Bacterial pre-peptidase C-terminal domain
MFRLGLILSFGLSALYAQTCLPAPILPGAAATGTVSATDCTLSDGTPYTAYQLTLPVRGQAKFALDPNPAGLTLIVRDSTSAQVASGAAIAQPLEAGTYSVLVSFPGPPAAGTLPGDTSYTLQTGFTAEPGPLCSTFPLLGLNQTAAGTLGSSGCRLPDGTLYEAYTINTLGAGNLTVAVSSQAFKPWLMVRGDDGSPLASDAASVTVPVAGSSSYQIAVATSDGTGAYQLTTAFSPAPTETCLPQPALGPSTSDRNSISTTSCSVITDDAGDQAFYNYYNLSLAAAGLVDIAVASEDFAPTIYLQDANGNTLATDSGGGAMGGNYPGSEIRLNLPMGSYFVQVFSNYASGGNYALTYNFTAGPAQPCATAALNPGTPAVGTLSASSCRSQFGLSDLYMVTLPASGTISLDLNTSSFTGQIGLRDSKDNLIVVNQDVEQLGNSHISATLPPGTYSVVAAAISGSGQYELDSVFTATAISPCAYAQPLNLNTGYIQNLSSASCIGSNGQPMDLYQFTLPVDSTIAAVMTSSQFDPYLKLMDSAGNVLRTDDNSYGYNDPLIAQFLPAGSYQLMARAASGTVGGLYQVNLLASAGPRPPFCGSKGTLAPGGSIAGILTFTACQFSDATFADVYAITLDADGSIDLRLNSSDFDAYLVLQDAKGNLLAQDDDGGGGTNARIQQKLPAGTYYVYAKPFANYYSLGGYTLTLSVL